jgi:hypothetical protein
VIEDLLTAGAEAVADTAVGGMPIRRRMRRVRQEAERLLEPGEKLRLVVRAATGPSLVGFWILAGIMVGGILSTMFAPEGNDELLGLWFLFAALVFTVGIVVVRSLWRPVGVAVTDRRLLLTRNAWRTHRVKERGARDLSRRTLLEAVTIWPGLVAARQRRCPSQACSARLLGHRARWWRSGQRGLEGFSTRSMNQSVSPRRHPTRGRRPCRRRCLLPGHRHRISQDIGITRPARSGDVQGPPDHHRCHHRRPRPA